MDFTLRSRYFFYPSPEGFGCAWADYINQECQHQKNGQSPEKPDNQGWITVLLIEAPIPRLRRYQLQLRRGQLPPSGKKYNLENAGLSEGEAREG